MSLFTFFAGSLFLLKQHAMSLLYVPCHLEGAYLVDLAGFQFVLSVTAVLMYSFT